MLGRTEHVVPLSVRFAGFPAPKKIRRRHTWSGALTDPITVYIERGKYSHLGDREDGIRKPGMEFMLIQS